MCDDGYGPPTPADDAWFQHHVVSKGYPKLKREPRQYPGQARLMLTDPTLEDTWATEDIDDQGWWADFDAGKNPGDGS